MPDNVKTLREFADLVEDVPPSNGGRSYRQFLLDSADEIERQRIALTKIKNMRRLKEASDVALEALTYGR